MAASRRMMPVNVLLPGNAFQAVDMRSFDGAAAVNQSLRAALNFAL
jgi:hypothetical protein